MKNIIAVDQELHGLAVVKNGKRTQIDSFDDLKLPKGGGVIVADGNAWSIFNGKSKSQYAFDTAEDREKFLADAADQGYKSISVSNKYARLQYLKTGHSQPDAVEALYAEVKSQIKTIGRFDSGKPVRENRGDVSYGMRDMVSQDFLLLQNSGGYESDFMKSAVEIAWNALDKRGKQLFNLKIRTPETSSPNRLAAVLVCTHNPETGERREHNGKPWGMGFITRRILCLNGTMQGTGSLSPGSPMRAVLRILGRRHSGNGLINRDERAEMDRYVKTLIREFQKHETIG